MAQELALTTVGTSSSTAMGAPPPTSLAPGFRFHPTDEELVRYYLRRKACGKPFRFQVVAEIDVNKYEPWELPGHSPLKSHVCYFFSPVDKKNRSGSFVNRSTKTGFWKASGKDKPILYKNQKIGMKKILIFHSGRAPDGHRTNWVMHEYMLCDPELESVGIVQEKDAFVLCRIFEKSGTGRSHGDRYAPFVEEEWNEELGPVVPRGDIEDNVAKGDEVLLVHYVDADQDNRPLNIAPPNFENTIDSREPEPSALPQKKRPRHDDPSSSHANWYEDSTTSYVPLTFDSSNLEKSLPPGYLKVISNLENEILNVSMKKEALKIELLKAQAIINTLQSQVQILSRDHEELRIHI